MYHCVSCVGTLSKQWSKVLENYWIIQSSECHIDATEISGKMQNSRLLVFSRGNKMSGSCVCKTKPVSGEERATGKTRRKDYWFSLLNYHHSLKRKSQTIPIWHTIFLLPFFSLSTQVLNTIPDTSISTEIWLPESADKPDLHTFA